jgi:uncharacterized protein with PIN domain
MRTSMRKKLRCPSCDSRLIDEDGKTQSQAMVAEGDTPADYYLKCRVCKKEIAIKKLN